MLILHDNASVHKSNVVQAAIRKANFGEVNHPAYSPDIAPSDYYLFKNLKAFLRGKNFYSDDEVITTVEEHLNNLGSGFFSMEYKVCITDGNVWLLAKVITFNKCSNCYLIAS